MNHLTPIALDMINSKGGCESFREIGGRPFMVFDRIELLPSADGTVMNFYHKGIMLMTKLGDHAMKGPFNVIGIEGIMQIDIVYKRGE